MYEIFTYDQISRYKKKYQNKKKYKIYSCQYRRKYENIKNQHGYFCKSQIILEFSQNKPTDLINKSFCLIEGHSTECLNLNLINLPEVKEVTNEQKEFYEKLHKYLEQITMLNKKYIKDEINKISNIINILKYNKLKFLNILIILYIVIK